MREAGGRRAVLLAALIGSIGAARGKDEDPTRLGPGVADRALEHLAEGSLHIEWDSHGEAPPRLLVVVAAAVVEVPGEGVAQVMLERRALGAARPHKGAWKWSFPRAPGEVEAGPVDPTRLLVPSREVEGMFVNLARLLKQPCAPRFPALDLPALDREEADRRAQGVQAGRPEGALEARGWLRTEGKALLLVSEEATWELVPARPALAPLLQGRDGAEAHVRLVPRGEAKGGRQKATVERVFRVVTPAPPAEEEEDPRTSIR